MSTNLDRQSADESMSELASLEQCDRLLVTLSCIGDAVVTADANGAITLFEGGPPVFDRLDSRRGGVVFRSERSSASSMSWSRKAVSTGEAAFIKDGHAA
jgi:hypothetical protein